jgi:hypothetical protein
MREKQLEVQKRTFDLTRRLLSNAIYNAIKGNPQKNEQAMDALIDEELKQIQ